MKLSKNHFHNFIWNLASHIQNLRQDSLEKYTHRGSRTPWECLVRNYCSAPSVSTAPPKNDGPVFCFSILKTFMTKAKVDRKKMLIVCVEIRNLNSA